MRRALSAVPTAAQMPWPSEPVATSTNDSRGVGCPSRSESNRRSLSSSARGKEPGVRPGGVEDRRRVPLRQHEAVVVGILRVLRIEAHLAEEQRRDDLGRRHAGRRMTAPGFGRRLDRIDAKLGGEVLQGGNRFRRSHFVQESLSQVRVGRSRPGAYRSFSQELRSSETVGAKAYQKPPDLLISLRIFLTRNEPARCSQPGLFLSRRGWRSASR